MKKIFVCLITILFITFTGCSTNINNTPTKKVEEFFNRYQTLDSKVISELFLVSIPLVILKLSTPVPAIADTGATTQQAITKSIKHANLPNNCFIAISSFQNKVICKELVAKPNHNSHLSIILFYHINVTVLLQSH